MGAQAVRLSNVDINNALENKDFEVLFQPIFDLANGGLARLETFVRWRHPSLGVLPPGAFISFFESQGRMSELTRYVLNEAIEGYLAWRGPYAPGFSINLALTDLSDDAFAPHLTKVLRDREFPADLVTLECPMPPVDADLDAAAESFQRLRKTGARLAIEVRGRANDFLRTIDPFPFDEIKTGGSSILRFARTVRGPGLSAISDLLDVANKANAVITAVGVEDQASLAALRGLGFSAAQGNHLAKVGDLKDFRPGRVNDVRELLELPPLSNDDLAAMFRTEAPAPKAAASAESTEDASQEDGDIVDRLNARMAREKEAAESADAPAQEAPMEQQPAAADAQSTEEQEEALKKQALRERARKKAKALALAKRAKAREARKVAAIKRAKAKAAQQADEEQLPAEENTADAADAASFEPSLAPHDMQERLAKEFEGGDMPEEPEEEIEANLTNETRDAEETDEPSEEKAPRKALDEATQSIEAEAPEPVEETPEAPKQQSFTDIDLKDDPHTAGLPPAAVQKEAQTADEQLRLPIGQTSAKLQKGIRVMNTPASIAKTPFDDEHAAAIEEEIGDAEYNEQEEAETQDAAAKASEETPNEITIDEEDAETSVSGEDKLQAVDAPQLQEEQIDIRGTLFSPDNETPKDSPRPRRGDQSNAFMRMLKRKYRITHFWPKSWVRAARRAKPQLSAEQ